MLTEAMEPKFWLVYAAEEVEEPVGGALGPKSSTRHEVNPERRFEPWPDGRIHGRDSEVKQSLSSDRTAAERGDHHFVSTRRGTRDALREIMRVEDRHNCGGG